MHSEIASIIPVVMPEMGTCSITNLVLDKRPCHVPAFEEHPYDPTTSCTQVEIPDLPFFNVICVNPLAPNSLFAAVESPEHFDAVSKVDIFQLPQA